MFGIIQIVNQGGQFGNCALALSVGYSVLRSYLARFNKSKELRSEAKRAGRTDQATLRAALEMLQEQFKSSSLSVCRFGANFARQASVSAFGGRYLRLTTPTKPINLYVTFAGCLPRFFVCVTNLYTLY